MPKNLPPFQVLIVEDNLGDARLLEFLFQNCGIDCKLRVAKDGVEAVDFLFQKDGVLSDYRPDLILMDLNLPRKDGRELLKEIKANRELCAVPVVMVTTSSNPMEIGESYRNGANAFISKPIDVELFQQTINAITALWFTYAKLATR